MKTIYETSNRSENAHVSLVKYRNLNNISHYHRDHELVYINEGKATVTVNESAFDLQSGMAVFIHSNDIHYISSDASTVITVLKANNDYFRNLFMSRRLSSPQILNNYGIDSSLNEISSEQKAYGEYSDIIINCIATQLFAHIFRGEKTYAYSAEEPHKIAANEIYSKISHKIFTEYSTLTFDEAAEYMHLSRPYFSKVFHSIFGMTFTHYLNTVKVAVAIEKIRAGNITVTDIAASCGFNTIRNFNRVFKSFTGFTPNSLPKNYIFMYSLNDTYGLDPTLICTEIIQ